MWREMSLYRYNYKSLRLQELYDYDYNNYQYSGFELDLIDRWEEE